MNNVKKKDSLINKLYYSSITPLLIAIVIIFFTITISTFLDKRKDVLERVDSLAKIIGENSNAAIIFKDKRRIFKILNSFKNYNDISYIVIYDKNYKRYAWYFKNHKSNFQNICQKTDENHIFFFNKIITCNNIIFQGKVIGKTEIGFSLKNINLSLFKNLIFIIFAGIFSFILLSLYMRKLQKSILIPLIELTENMKKFSIDKNLDIEVVNSSDDEVGVLIDTFNSMIVEIRRREELLEEYSKNLEALVSRRTEQLLLAKEKAVEADKAKSNFIANISHEIRTPLNSIIGYSDLIESKINNKELKQYVNNIKNSANILNFLFNDIIEFTKTEKNKISINYQFLNLNDFFNRLKNIFELRLKEKNLNFIIEMDKGLPEEIYADGKRLTQVLINVIGNAVKFTDSGFVKITVRGEKKYNNIYDLEFIVEDTGIGIESDDLKIIFEPFMVGKKNQDFTGTGIGLNICKNILNLMNGTIEASNRKEGGAIFKIKLFNVKTSKSEVKSNRIFEVKTDKLHFDYINKIDRALILNLRLILEEYKSAINFNLLREDIKNLEEEEKNNEYFKKLCNEFIDACDNYDFEKINRLRNFISDFEKVKKNV